LAELHAIFGLPIFTRGERPRGGGGEASYWIPLLLLWTGARPEEVAQLLVSDVAQDPEDGRWVIRITDEGQHPHKGRRTLKTAKTNSGRRIFSIPPALIDLGFLSYVEWLRAAGEPALFPALRPKGQRNDIFAQFGAWWSKYLKKHGAFPAGEGRRPSREFRDNWATAARVSGIGRDAHEYIMGHSTAGRSANVGYGSRAHYGREAEKISYKGLDLSRVRPWTPPK
jgi:integrase